MGDGLLMRSIRYFLVVVIVTLLNLNPLLVYANQLSFTENVEAVIIVYKNEAGKEAAIERSIEVEHEFEKLPALAVTLTKAGVIQLEKNPNIEYIQENVEVSLIQSVSAIERGTYQTHITGLLAVLKERNPHKTNTELRNEL